jgi:ATP-dependent Lhr-like helicase
VSTSTLELGIDVGDLDRVVQVNAPPTVASFRQRLGRSGRRAGSTRSCLFLTLDHDALLRAAGLLLLWGRGYVEPVSAPPQPRHIVAQQLLALCLQEHRIGSAEWADGWNGLAPFDRSAEPILRHLLDQGFVDRDGEILFVGPNAEQRFGRRHFMGMTAVFTVAPEFTVLAGRQEIGRTDPMSLTEKVDGPRLLLLAGRSWRVTWVDWKRRRCQVEPADSGGRASWHGAGTSGDHFDLTRAARDVVLGDDPPGSLTQRAVHALTEIREKYLPAAYPGGTVIHRDNGEVRWWTWAGYRANATLTATLPDLTDRQRFDDASIRLRRDLTREMWQAATAGAEDRLCLPDVDDRALAGLKFTEALPHRLATATLAARLADPDSAATVLAEPIRFVSSE